MAAHDYQCGDCGAVQELIQSIHTPLPEALPCPRCGNDSFYVFLVAPGIMTSNFSDSHKSLDIAIGKDAADRWNRINERQAQRDKIRKESGKAGLTATGRDTYEAHDKPLIAVTTPEPTK